MRRARVEGPGDQASRRRVPRLRRRARLDMAVRIADNAKTQRQPVQHDETLVHAGIAARSAAGAIYAAKGVELRGDERARAVSGMKRRPSRLIHRIPCPDPGGAGGRCRTRQCTSALRLAALTPSSPSTTAMRCASCARSTELGAGQRVDALRRRLRIRSGRGDGIRPKAPRAARGPRADQREVIVLGSGQIRG